MDAIEGDDADQFGPRIFDLSPNGCNFRIKVDKQGDYPSYVSSRFLMPAALDVTEDKAKTIYETVHDLEEVLPRKSQDELKAMIDEHYLCVDPSSTSSSQPSVVSDTPVVTTGAAADPALEEDVPWGDSTPKTEEPDTKKDDVDDDMIKSLLDGLDD